MTTSQFTGTSPRIQGPEDLLLSFRTGEKPRPLWRVGTEHEKLGFIKATGRPIPYEGPQGVRAILEQFIARFAWHALREGENLIALQRDQASITLEPGGQLELSGAPLSTAFETGQELALHIQELEAISRDLGLVWLNVGRNPLLASADMPWMPKERYAIMHRYLPTQGAMAMDMMVGTGTVQTNLDYSSERDMARKLRLGLAAGPFLTALFANSPFAEGRPTGFLSTRGQVWLHTDPRRSGFPPVVFKDDFGYRDYAQYALDVPMFFIHRGGHYVDLSGQSFRQFLERGWQGEWPTQEDWVLHLTVLFPEARLKSYIELRMADVGSPAMITALSALTRGLFYDEAALKEAGFLLRGLRVELLPELQREAIRLGLKAQALGRPLQGWLQDLLQIAKAGLNRLRIADAQGRPESALLEPLEEIVESGLNQADRLLQAWERDWGRSVTPILRQLGYPA